MRAPAAQVRSRGCVRRWQGTMDDIVDDAPEEIEAEEETEADETSATIPARGHRHRRRRAITFTLYRRETGLPLVSRHLAPSSHSTGY
jgi:hypothetical protein